MVSKYRSLVKKKKESTAVKLKASDYVGLPKNAAGALYKKQCHMSAVTATVTTGAIMFGHR